MFDKERAPTAAMVKKYVFLSPMLDSALAEMREFAKKKQDGIVTATKIKILNRLLSDVREVLAREESVNYLEPLDEQELPQNSDAVLILGQYKAALNSFHDAHYRWAANTQRWVTQEWIDEYERDDESELEEEDDEEE